MHITPIQLIARNSMEGTITEIDEEKGMATIVNTNDKTSTVAFLNFHASYSDVRQQSNESSMLSLVSLSLMRMKSEDEGFGQHPFVTTASMH